MRAGEVGASNSDILTDKADDDADARLPERCVSFFLYKLDRIIVRGKVIKLSYLCVYFPAPDRQIPLDLRLMLPTRLSCSIHSCFIQLTWSHA